MADYSVQTDVYNGPLDLLLYLIRRDEVDIYDIPIARVTEQYCRYVETLAAIDPNVAGDFLVMAATLMEIKSRMLLPRPPVEEGGEEDLSDPRLELVRQLLEYKKFKDASFELGAAAQLQAMKWSRIPARDVIPKSNAVDLEDVQIWDLVAAFNQLMSSIGAKAPTHDVLFDDTPISLHATDLLDRLVREGRDLGFEEVFIGRTKVEMIGLFLALLELIRQKRVAVRQELLHGPISITLLSAEPITVGGEWEYNRAGEAAMAGRAPEDDSEAADESGEDTVVTEAGARRGAADDDGAEMLDELDEEDAAAFAELDRIKTDIDIDGVLHEGVGESDDEEQP